MTRLAPTVGPAGRAVPVPGDGSREVLRLAVAGAPAVPLLFVEEAGSLYVVPTDPPGAWFAAAMRERSVGVRLPDGREETAEVRLRTEADRVGQVHAALRGKYGDAVWDRYFSASQTVLELLPGQHGPPPVALERIRGEFEAAAEYYDARIEAHRLDRYLKDRVVELSLRSLEGCDPILELGPGTGYHTLRLLEAGHHVLAVDLSPRMLARLETRAAAATLSGRLTTRVGSAGDLEELLRDVPDGGLGGVFSAFGALDLERDLGGTARLLARLLRLGGRLAFTSLNRPGWLPVLWELGRARVGAAVTRGRREVPPGSLEYPLGLYPRSADDWDRLLGDGFLREERRAVSLLAPPFDPERALRFLGADGRAKLRRWDERLSAGPLAPSGAEWQFLVYRRASGAL